MRKAEQLVQCKLVRTRDDCTGFDTLVAWIPKRAAVTGKRVELLPSKEWWSVRSVGVEMDSDAVKEREQGNRKGMPSVERGWRDAQ